MTNTQGRVLFLAGHRPGRAPGQRFRFEQYLGYLQSLGWDCHFSYLLSERDDEVMYTPGHTVAKVGVLARSVVRRLRDVLRARSFDIVFIQREALMIGTAAVERAVAFSEVPIVFDFDDSIWLENVSQTNRRWAWLKNAAKTETIITHATRVFAGNQYLADYASRYSDSVRIIPTTIDTEAYRPDPASRPRGSICIGWSGSPTTIQHLETVIPALRAVKERFGDRVTFKVIGDGSYRNEALGIEGEAWNPATELADLNEMDIGIMPLPDDRWSWGKCGLKGLQYMALEIPSVMSPVGVNREILGANEYGLLASTQEEWIGALSRLIESSDLRMELGCSGRERVASAYSVKAWRSTYAEEFEALLRSPSQSDRT